MKHKKPTFEELEAKIKKAIEAPMSRRVKEEIKAQDEMANKPSVYYYNEGIDEIIDMVRDWSDSDINSLIQRLEGL